jgi:hypothetical protein
VQGEAERINRIMKKIYFEYGGVRYLVNHPTNGAVLPERQQTQVARGEYGPLVKGIFEAQTACGAEHRFAWRGIINALGDFEEVLPPTKPSVVVV